MSAVFDARYLAIALAIVGAGFLAFGTQFQNDAVGETSGNKKAQLHGSVNIKQMLKLARNKRWLLGMTLIGGALVLQIAALSMAPLIVVQPLGAIALVITSLLNARISRTKLNKVTVLAISLCMLGVGLFVVRASAIAHGVPITDDLLLQVMFTLSAIILIFAFFLWRSKGKAKAITYIMGAGILYGFVATLTKVVIVRIEQGQFEWLTVACALVLGVAVVMGGWFVQNAYASGPPDLVIAGLTVVDPLVAVLIAITILQEAKEASLLEIFGFLISGAIAVTGVLLLSQFHPQILLAKRRAKLFKRRSKK
ncbi:MAG: DMT family transporter [Micrococcales bacterium]